jgi:hypothetical protein
VQIKSLRIINNILAEYNFWSMISRDAAKKWLKSVIGIPLIYNDEAIERF